MPDWIEGPTLRILQNLGLSGRRLHVLTAFYSAQPLAWLSRSIKCREVILGVRHDPLDPKLWISGYVDPEALLSLYESLEERGARVKLFSSPKAHAKLYIGDDAVIIGSANLTMRGFGAGMEVVMQSGRQDVESARESADAYLRNLDATPLPELRRYVSTHREAAKLAKAERRRERKKDENSFPTKRVQGPSTLAGSYSDFRGWLEGQPGLAAKEIADRASGKQNLQGHIHRNFFGVRQFLLANPALLEKFRRTRPDEYSLSKDISVQRKLAQFVGELATDEQSFSLDTWKTYLPRECGGRAGRKGGTIGNLNRMLPLIASYLNEKE